MSALETGSHLRACSVERERIARDLHDGVVQSLIAAEIQVELLRHQNTISEAASDRAKIMENLQDLLRREIRKLRGQIDQLRSCTTPKQILPCLAGMLDEFQQETGIVTTFACDVQAGPIPRSLSREVLYIVEEALSNVRKHSGARKAELYLSFRDETLQVVIQDDGCGFDFTGRLSLAQLEAIRKGPQVIKERVQSMDGEFALDSDPNRGARLEIQFASGRQVPPRRARGFTDAGHSKQA
jgi:two-component system nitrate/nitrite sensor histidine kinase NarX